LLIRPLQAGPEVGFGLYRDAEDAPRAARPIAEALK
jgi:hypothetical protein